MVNKTLKAVVAASALLVAGSVYPIAGGDNTVVTQCIQGGQTVSASGQACSTQAGSQGSKGAAGVLSRARGDVVTFDNIKNKTPIKLPKSGSIAIPAKGVAMEYSFGKMRIVIASFDLTIPTTNLPNKLARIVNIAHQNNPDANSMVLVAVATQGTDEFTEAIETYSDLEDLTKSKKIQYKATGPNSIMATIPASKNAPAQSLMLDLNPITK